MPATDINSSTPTSLGGGGGSRGSYAAPRRQQWRHPRSHAPPNRWQDGTSGTSSGHLSAAYRQPRSRAAWPNTWGARCFRTNMEPAKPKKQVNRTRRCIATHAWAVGKRVVRGVSAFVVGVLAQARVAFPRGGSGRNVLCRQRSILCKAGEQDGRRLQLSGGGGRDRGEESDMSAKGPP